MANSKEEHLKPLRNLCTKLDSNESVEKLKEYIVKHEFYEGNVIGIITELLKNKEIQQDAPVVMAAFQILNFIITRGKYSYTVFVSLYNYSLSDKDNMSSIIADEFFNICKQDISLNSKNLEMYLLFNDRLCSINSINNSKERRETIYANFRRIIAKIEDHDEQLQVKLFRTFNQRVNDYIFKDKNLTRTYEYINEVIVGGLQDSQFKFSSVEIFDLYLKLLTYIYSNDTDASLSENNSTIGQMMETIHTILANEEQQRCNQIILVCNRLLANVPVAAKSIKELLQKYFKNMSKDSAQSEVTQKTLKMVMKMLFLKTDKFQNTIECYTVYHELTYSFLNILKNIKSEANVISCCSNIKRHEIIKIIFANIKFLSELVSLENVSSKLDVFVKHYINYGLEICNELKCDSKGNELTKLFFLVYNILLFMHNNQAAILQNIKSISFLFKFAIEMLSMDIKKVDMSQYTANFAIIGSAIYERLASEEDKDIAKLTAEGLSRVYNLKNQLCKNATGDKIMEHQRSLQKTLFHMRKLAVILDYPNATELLKKLMKSSKEISFEEVLVNELISVARYDAPNLDERCKIFKSICNQVENTAVFAQACNVINETVLKSCDSKKFDDLNERLEKEMSRADGKDVNKLLALIANNYYLYLTRESEFAAEMKDNYIDEKIPKCFNLQKELKLLSYLSKSLTFCNKLYVCIEKDKTCIDKIQSKNRFLSIIENMSSQFCLRGVEFKDIEAKSFLWMFLLRCEPQQQQQEMILDTATYFLDNHNKLIDSSGNNIRVSKSMNPVRIEEIISESNKVAECLIEKFDVATSLTQVKILNYLISVWQYHMMNGRRDEGLKSWEKFSTLKATSLIQENPTYDLTIKAKVNFAMAELNMSICKRNSADLVNEAVANIRDVSMVYAEFSNIFLQVMQNVYTKTLQFSVNRLLDMDHFVCVIRLLKDRSIRKGYFIKTLEYLQLSVLWKLNMERVEEAKDDLTVLTKLLQIKNEIPVKIPLKEKPIVTIPSVTSAHLVRDASIDTPKKTKLLLCSNDDGDGDSSIAQQLIQLIHERSCKCTMCEYPLLTCMIFQTACHYARIFWLLGRFHVSKEFCENVLDGWRNFCGKVQRSNSKYSEILSINKMDFITSSIRWLFQAADTFIRTKDYEDAEEIYTEIDLVCTKNVFDHECFRESLYSRKENLELLMKSDDFNEHEEPQPLNELNFEQFCKIKGIKPKIEEKTEKKRLRLPSNTTKFKLSPPAPTIQTPSASSSSASLKKVTPRVPKIKSIDEVIYIDSDDSFRNEEPQKVKQKDKIMRPATNIRKTTKKTTEKPSKKKEEDPEATNNTPATRPRRRMI